ncbi:MAG: hypothetical protein HY881_16255 [Deltaproteobacteria bacterium]|nr:hypothetical protein [Deltaproteobacteria bacterium]
MNKVMPATKKPIGQSPEAHGSSMQVLIRNNMDSEHLSETTGNAKVSGCTKRSVCFFEYGQFQRDFIQKGCESQRITAKCRWLAFSTSSSLIIHRTE